MALVSAETFGIGTLQAAIRATADAHAEATRVVGNCENMLEGAKLNEDFLTQKLDALTDSLNTLLGVQEERRKAAENA